MAKDIEFAMTADDQASPTITLLKAKVEELNARLLGLDRSGMRVAADGTSQATMSFIKGAKELTKLAAGIQAIRGVAAIGTAAIGAMRGDVDSLRASIQILPFGIGPAANAIWDLVSATKDYVGMRPELKEMEELNLKLYNKLKHVQDARAKQQKDVEQQTRTTIAGYKRDIERQLAIDSAGGDFERRMEEINQRRADTAKQIKDLEDALPKDSPLRKQYQKIRSQINDMAYADIDRQMAEEAAKRAEKSAKAEQERADKIASLDANIEENRLRFLNREYDAAVFRIKQRYETQIREAKRANDAEMIDRLEKERESELDLAAMQQRSGAKKDKEKNAASFGENVAIESRFAWRGTAKTAEEQLATMKAISVSAFIQRQHLGQILQELKRNQMNLYVGAN